MHDLEGVVDILLHLLSVDGREWIMHPGLLPALPVRHRNPQVPVGLEVLHKLGQLVVLQ